MLNKTLTKSFVYVVYLVLFFADCWRSFSGNQLQPSLLCLFKNNQFSSSALCLWGEKQNQPAIMLLKTYSSLLSHNICIPSTAHLPSVWKAGRCSASISGNVSPLLLLLTLSDKSGMRWRSDSIREVLYNPAWVGGPSLACLADFRSNTNSSGVFICSQVISRPDHSERWGSQGGTGESTSVCVCERDSVF